jgi:acetyltransferase-like isoleucine patch superfamily enzyme
VQSELLYRLLSHVCASLTRIKHGLDRRLVVSQLNSCGRNVYIDARNSYFTAQYISIGSDVYIGPGADFGSLSKPIKIGNKVLIGPNVSIRTDNHNISCIGRFMYDCHDRRPQDEAEIVIEDDVWIGTRVTILKGVRIGRGSVIGAGTIVTCSVPPYSIVVGPGSGKVLRKRFTDEEILRHESLLYPEVARLPPGRADAESQ